MSTELAKTNINTMLAQEAGTTFSSLQLENADRATQSKLFKALNNPNHRVADFINKSFPVEHVLIEAADILNEETGEISRVPRVVLISPDGTSYQAISQGIFNSIKYAYKCFGEAPWKPALTFHIKQVPVKNGSMLTADIEG